MPSDILRETEPAAPAAAPAPSPLDMIGRLTEETGKLGEARGRLSDELIQLRKGQYERMAPLLGQMREMPAPPHAPDASGMEMPPQPSRAIRPFLQSREGESPWASVQKALTAMTALAGQFGGTPRTALASLTGSLQGWAAGDRERGNREWEAWKENVKMVKDDWARKVDTFNAQVKEWQGNQDALLSKLKIFEVENHLQAQPIEDAIGRVDAIQKQLTDQGKLVVESVRATSTLEQLRLGQLRLEQSIAQAARQYDLGMKRLEEQQRHNRAAEATQAQRADVKNDKMLGNDAAKWENDAGERPAPTETIVSASAKGYRPSSKQSPADSRRVADTLIEQLFDLIPKLESKGFLAKGETVISTGKSSLKRMWRPGDSDITAWMAHAGTMVAIQRQLGDIGPRAMAAYDSAVNVIKHPTTAAGARQALENLRDALHAGQPKRGEGGGAARIRVRAPDGRTGTFPAGQTLPPGYTEIK